VSQSEATIAPFADWRSLIGHGELFAKILEAEKQGVLAPVVLLVGREGIGKKTLAAKIAAISLCETNSACGACQECLAIIQNRHPEISWFDHQPFQVEHADLVQEHLSLQANAGSTAKRRTVVICDGDAMTVAAANRLLKTLEEPPDRCRIILTTARSGQLPDTLLSRCSQWLVAPPPVAQSCQWLAEQPDIIAAKLDRLALTELLHEEGLSPGLVLQRVANIDQVQELARQIQACLAPLNPGEALQLAENLGKTKSLSSAALLCLLEKAMNQQYREYYQLKEARERQLNLPAWSVIKRRRQLLKKLKSFVFRSKTKVNMQLFFEAWMALQSSQHVTGHKGQ